MSENPKPKHSQKWFITVIASIALAFCFIIWGNQLFGPTVPHLRPSGWAAAVAALAVLLIKFCISATRKKEYKPHEQGYEASIMAAGAAIPAAAAALVNDDPHLSAWLLFSLISLGAIFVTAAIAAAAEDNDAGSFAWVSWTVANFIFGGASFLFYIFMIIIKAQI